MRKLVALSIVPILAAPIALATPASAAPAAGVAASGPQLPNLVQIIDCTIGLVDQLLFTGRPAPDCFGVP